MKRIIGFALLILGFVCICVHILLYAANSKVFVQGVEVENRPYQSLEVESIKSTVFDGMKKTQSFVILPAIAMLAGGIILGWKRKTK
jgi:hypothetical protein